MRHLVRWKPSETGVRGKSEKTGPWEGAHGCQAVITGPKACDYWCPFRFWTEKIKEKEEPKEVCFTICFV